MSSFLDSSYILEISPLSDVRLVKIFSHSLGCCFVLFTVSFDLQKLFSFRRSHLLIVPLSVCAVVIFRKWFSIPMHSRLHHTFSSIRFSVIKSMLRSLVHLDLSFVHGDRYRSIFILLHVDIHICQHDSLKMLFSTVQIWFLCQKTGVHSFVD